MGLMKEIYTEAQLQLGDGAKPEEIRARAEEIRSDFRSWLDEHREADFEAFVKYCIDNTIDCCAECGSPEVGEVGCGDEGWTVCPDCQTVEGKTYGMNPFEYERKFG